jgi:hypothetical protein
MWLITKAGFYSVVQHRENHDLVLIRSRVGADIRRLKEQYIPGLELVKNENADYPFRAIATKKELANAMVQMIQELDYDNFKNMIHKVYGHARHEVYSRIWGILHQLQAGPSKYSWGSQPESNYKAPQRAETVSGLRRNADGQLEFYEKRTEE